MDSRDRVRRRSRSPDRRRRDETSSHRSRDRDRDRDRGRDRDYRRSDRRDRDRGHRSSRRSRDDSRTPSPITVPPGTSKWDKAPQGYEGMDVHQVAQSDPSLLMPMLIQKNPQQARQSRRLYIGNVPPGVSEAELKEFFEAAIRAANLTATQDPLVGTQVSQERGFAFLEFRNPEDATQGMLLDGIVLHNQSLKVRRPKDYQAGSSEEPQPTMQAIPGIISTTVPDSEHKIFIGGLPSYLGEDQVKELLVTFGELRGFNLVKDSKTNMSKGYAFFEYLDHSNTEKATQALNGIKMGEKTLVVQRAASGQDAGPEASVIPQLLQPGLITLAGSGEDAGTPTRVLQLLNMVTLAELADDEEYEDIRLDIQEECGKYGTVEKVDIPRPSREEMESNPSGTGQVYVMFADVEGSKAAQTALGGRTFASRTVITSFFEEARFESKDF